MKFKINLNKIGISRSVDLEDSIINARRVLKYQKKIDSNFADSDGTSLSAFNTAQADTLEDIVIFLTDILNLSDKEVSNLEEHSYYEVSKIAGNICSKILRTEEDEETDEEDDSVKK